MTLLKLHNNNRSFGIYPSLIMQALNTLTLAESVLALILLRLNTYIGTSLWWVGPGSSLHMGGLTMFILLIPWDNKPRDTQDYTYIAPNEIKWPPDNRKIHNIFVRTTSMTVTEGYKCRMTVTVVFYGISEYQLAPFVETKKIF